MRSAGTAHVVLGILQWEPRSGYEIKQLIDRSTRFFWAASYGQIYPELRRLESDGLIEGADDPASGRGRRVWRITSAGRRALEDWLREDEEPLFETRDEGMLKFFFAHALAPAEAEALVGRLQRRHERILARLQEIENEIYGPEGTEHGFPYESLQHGIALHRWIAAWYADAARRLERSSGHSTMR